MVRMKKYLSVKAILPVKGRLATPEDLEIFQLFLCKIVFELGGQVCDYRLTDSRLVHATIYWKQDPIDRDRDSLCPRLTDIWLRNIMPTLRDFLHPYDGVAIEIITDMKLKEKLV